MSQPDLTPPVPISGEAFGDNLSVLFDRHLLPGVLDPSNWTARWDSIIRIATSAIAVGSQVNLVTEEDEGDIGPDKVSYNAMPPDVLSLDGTPAASFDAFPIT